MKDAIIEKLVTLGRADGETKEQLIQRLSKEVGDSERLKAVLDRVYSTSEEDFAKIKEKLVHIL